MTPATAAAHAFFDVIKLKSEKKIEMKDDIENEQMQDGATATALSNSASSTIADADTAAAATSSESQLTREERRKLKKKRKVLDRNNIATVIKPNASSSSLSSSSVASLSSIYTSSMSPSLDLKLSSYFINGRSTLRSRELQHLICWILGDEELPTQWIFVKNRPMIEKVVLVCVDGVTQETVMMNNELGAIFTELFPQPQSQPIPLLTSHSSFNRSSVLADYLSCGIKKVKKSSNSSAVRKKQKREDGSAAPVAGEKDEEEADDSDDEVEAENVTAEESKESSSASPSNPLLYLRECLISDTEMTIHNYPIPSRNEQNDFRRSCCPENCSLNMQGGSMMTDASGATPPMELSPEWLAVPCVHTTTAAVDSFSSSSTPVYAPSSSTPRLFAIDCEMSYTSLGLELTRATLLSSSGTILFDTFVRPEREIVDYNTKYSGITPQMLAGVKTTLDDVRVLLSSHLSSSDILVGHSLENDLKAMKFMHRQCLDTAILYTHPRGGQFKNSLRFLTQKFLDGRVIQQGSQGHDSREDALAALDLARKKLELGRMYGEPKKERESIAAVLNRASSRTGISKNVCLVGPSSVIYDIVVEEPLYSMIVKEEDEEVTNTIGRECRKKETALVVGVLTGLRKKMATTTSGTVPLAAPSSSSFDVIPSTSSSASSIGSACQSFRQSLKSIIDAAPANALILIASGAGTATPQEHLNNNQRGVLWMRIK